ncbi:MAG: sialate O-acetylesterase [Gammaproteobacteria bacterium]|nr:sialate O-acetylesterase [Gammaproteobacteria bacterium]
MMPIAKQWWGSLAAAAGLLLLSACSGSESTPNTNTTDDFQIVVDQSVVNLTEGDTAGVNLNVSLIRQNNYAGAVQLSILGIADSDSVNMRGAFSSDFFSPSSNSTTLNLALNIGALPIQPQERRFVVRASSESGISDANVIVNVSPTSAPDVYLLVGQSNMVGFSGDGTKESYAGGPDEPNDRILQLNVTRNDQFNIFTTGTTFTSPASNVLTPALVRAEDPLHIPFDPENPEKVHAYIGLGLTFAKQALNDTNANVILVPAAWSGSAFCDNDGGPNGQWNAQSTSDGNLGNTWLFDRAVTRANMAISESGGVLRGILWHQGESDANERCSSSYLANLERLAQQFRTQIQPDRRGGDWRRSNSNIPFVVGSMSRGNDDRGDLSDFSEDKQRIDSAHRQLPSQIVHAAFSNHDDLTPANGYACGNTSCIHFGPAALREMGRRYYSALRQAAAQ